MPDDDFGTRGDISADSEGGGTAGPRGPANIPGSALPLLIHKADGRRARAAGVSLEGDDAGREARTSARPSRRLPLRGRQGSTPWPAILGSRWPSTPPKIWPGSRAEEWADSGAAPRAVSAWARTVRSAERLREPRSRWGKAREAKPVSHGRRRGESGRQEDRRTEILCVAHDLFDVNEMSAGRGRIQGILECRPGRAGRVATNFPHQTGQARWRPSSLCCSHFRPPR